MEVHGKRRTKVWRGELCSLKRRSPKCASAVFDGAELNRRCDWRRRVVFAEMKVAEMCAPNSTDTQVVITQFQQTSSINPYNIRFATNYRSVFCHTNVRQFCIRYSGPSTWNDTPDSMRSITTLHGFIKNFRKFLQGFNLTPEAH